MKDFESGINFYTTGTVKVHFPENQVICKWCPFCYQENGLNRFKCRMTNSIVYLPAETINGDCPIKFEVGV